MINRGYFVGNIARLCTGEDFLDATSWFQVDLGPGLVDPETGKPTWTKEAVVVALQALGHNVPNAAGWERRGDTDADGWCITGPATGA